jgi:dienelactone hydrolase
LDPVGLSEQRATLAGAGLAPCWPCLVGPDKANPAIIDPAISKEKQWLSEHYVWLDPAVEHREKLVVHLPGRSNTPSQFKYLAQEAARLGYHVIVLMYANTVGVGGGPASICKFTTYDKAAKVCQENVRLEVLDGKAHGAPPVHLVFPGMTAAHAEAHGVYHRLTKLLEHLAVARPGEDWSEFLHGRGPDRAPAWQKIVISGFSYGGSEAALIAKSHRVHRVTLFASPRDGSDAVSSPPNVPGPFVALGKTPAKRYYGLVHGHDPLHALTLASWQKLGMSRFGGAVFEDGITSSPPYDKTHMLLTDRRTLPDQKAGTTTYANAHGSVVNDQLTPIDDPKALWPAGTPLLGDVWRYMLGAHGQEGEQDSVDDSSDD